MSSVKESMFKYFEELIWSTVHVVTVEMYIRYANELRITEKTFICGGDNSWSHVGQHAPHGEYHLMTRKY